MKQTSKSGPPLCPDCGKNLDLVGRMHKCVPTSQSVPAPAQAPARKKAPAKKAETKPKAESGARVVKSLKQAVKHVRGDETAAISTTVKVAEPKTKAERLTKARDVLATVTLKSHPDCEVCNERRRKNRERMKKRRKGLDTQGK